MIWAIFPVLAAAFYGVANFISNYMIDNYLPKKKAGAFSLIHIFGYLASMLILLAVFGRSVFMLPPANAFGLILAGIVNVIGTVYYFKALQIGDTVDITIFSQVGPLFTLGMGVMFLHETIAPNQAFGFIIIMVGAAIIALASGGKGRSPDFKVAGMTVFYTFFSVLSDIIFAYALKGVNGLNHVLFAQAFFYFQFGSLLATVIALVCFKTWRQSIAKAVFKHRKSFLHGTLSLVDTLCFAIADGAFKFGLIITPVLALMGAISKSVGLFAAFFLAFGSAKIFPKIFKRKRLTKQMLVRYGISAALILVGIVVMSDF